MHPEQAAAKLGEATVTKEPRILVSGAKDGNDDDDDEEEDDGADSEAAPTAAVDA